MWLNFPHKFFYNVVVLTEKREIRYLKTNIVQTLNRPIGRATTARYQVQKCVVFFSKVKHFVSSMG